ncbi:MAG: 16S rRNA (adenine(1518)-N(6)/adenine(1519)-N(6))-dimethyltransferase RsmA [Oscillospiraceae bacterium]|nr:16S rRNA (adenine(1518)-N(6)/adenine(1519)-N(6))-dimethyltransferase RsmA [Oscillospiraceae bacterium]
MNVKHSSARNKSLGQNFLTDVSLLDRLAEGSGVAPTDAVLEIGAGLGGLTTALAKRAKSVLAVEIDRSLEPALRTAVSPYPNVEVCIADGMKLDWASWASGCLASRIGGDAGVRMGAGGSVRFVSNLPYYITTPLLTRAFKMNPPFGGIACMVQREVARKLCALPGDDDYGPLGIWARVRFTPRIVMDVPAAAFDPPPNVDSCFVICVALDAPLVEVEDYARFERLVNAAFASRRKALRNNLRAGFSLTAEQAASVLEQAGLPENVRAEELSAEGFAALIRALFC